MKLSKEQKKVLDVVNNAYDNKLDVVLVTGEAGSGKTTVAKLLYEESSFGVIEVATLAGRAAAVLREMGVKRATTIASLIYDNTPSVEGDREIWHQEVKQPNPEGKSKHILIFDEASMIPDGFEIDKDSPSHVKESGKSTLEDIRTYRTRLARASSYCLLVFVGDQHQLGPPEQDMESKETFSCAINQHWWEVEERVEEINLERTYRQSTDSPILQLARGVVDLRQKEHVDKEYKTCKWRGKTITRQDGQDDSGYIHYCNLPRPILGPGLTVIDDPVEKYIELYKKKGDTSISISFSNVKNFENNIHIREEIFNIDKKVFEYLESPNDLKFKPHDYPEEAKAFMDKEKFIQGYRKELKQLIPVKDDLLMAIKNNHWDRNLSFLNGDFVRVVDDYNHDLNTLPVYLIKNPNINFPDKWEGYRKIPFTLTMAKLKVEKISSIDSDESGDPVDRYFILETLSQNNGWQEERELNKNRIGAYLRAYIDKEFEKLYGEDILLMPIQEKTMKKDDLKYRDQYYNALHINYAYSVTAHKAQGGQWDNVIVDFDSPRSHQSPWAYTAITRAKSNLFLYKYPEEIIEGMDEDSPKYKDPVKNIGGFAFGKIMVSRWKDIMKTRDNEEKGKNEKNDEDDVYQKGLIPVIKDEVWHKSFGKGTVKDGQGLSNYFVFFEDIGEKVIDFNVSRFRLLSNVEGFEEETVWTIEEDTFLKTLHSENRTQIEIAKLMKKTPISVSIRLKKFKEEGLIS